MLEFRDNRFSDIPSLLRNFYLYFSRFFPDIGGIWYRRIASFVKISAVKDILYFKA